MNTSRLIAVFAIIGILSTIVFGCYVSCKAYQTFNEHTRDRQDPYMSGEFAQ